MKKKALRQKVAALQDLTINIDISLAMISLAKDRLGKVIDSVIEPAFAALITAEGWLRNARDQLRDLETMKGAK